MAMRYEGICRKCNIHCTGEAKGNCYKIQVYADRISREVLKRLEIDNGQKILIDGSSGKCMK